MKILKSTLILLFIILAISFIVSHMLFNSSMFKLPSLILTIAIKVKQKVYLKTFLNRLKGFLYTLFYIKS